MIIALATGSESCGYCAARIPAGELVALLTASRLRRCAECAKLDPLDIPLYKMQLAQSGGDEIGSGPAAKPDYRALSSIGRGLRAFKDLPSDVRERHERALLDRGVE